MTERFTSRLAVFIFLLRENKVFLMRRANTTHMNGWYGLPSGHVEGNEFITEAAQRELKEETGIDVPIQDLECVHVMYRRKEKNYVDFYFVAKNFNGEPTNFEPEKCDHAEWFEIETLPENTIDYVKDVLLGLETLSCFSERFSQ